MEQQRRGVPFDGHVDNPPDHDRVVAGFVLGLDRAVDPRQDAVDDRVAECRAGLPGDAAPLVGSRAAEAELTASWSAARTLTQHWPAARIDGKLVEVAETENATYGGSIETLKNAWQVSPAIPGSAAVPVAAVTTVTPEQKVLRTWRNCRGKSVPGWSVAISDLGKIDERREDTRGREVGGGPPVQDVVDPAHVRRVEAQAAGRDRGAELHQQRAQREFDRDAVLR